MIRVILCDDHALIRRGIRDTLADEADMRVVGEAGDYTELRGLMRGEACDVLVLDINLPGPQRAGRAARAEGRGLAGEGAGGQHAPRGAVRHPRAARRCLRLRQQGRRPAGHRQRRAHRGPGPQVRHARDRAERLVDSLTTPQNELPHQKLSDRELQTLVMIASGKRLSDIAEELMLSPKTVSVYRARVLEKLQLANNSELTVYAIRNGLVGQ
jgi:two-component system invasion response regulator UvrY